MCLCMHVCTYITFINTYNMGAGEKGQGGISTPTMLLLLLSGPAPNPCEANGGRGPCSHLCLINYNRTISCACPHLMKLHKDNTTCYGRKPPPLTATGKLRLKVRSEVPAVKQRNDRKRGSATSQCRRKEPQLPGPDMVSSQFSTCGA